MRSACHTNAVDKSFSHVRACPHSTRLFSILSSNSCVRCCSVFVTPDRLVHLTPQSYGLKLEEEKSYSAVMFDVSVVAVGTTCLRNEGVADTRLVTTQHIRFLLLTLLSILDSGDMQ